MPLFVYRCNVCGFEHEELQDFNDSAPEVEGCPVDNSESTTLHELERVMSACSHRFRGDNSSDGIGGWKRQGKNGETMVRQVAGQNSTKYGEGSV